MVADRFRGCVREKDHSKRGTVRHQESFRIEAYLSSVRLGGQEGGKSKKGKEFQKEENRGICVNPQVKKKTEEKKGIGYKENSYNWERKKKLIPKKKAL